MSESRIDKQKSQKNREKQEEEGSLKQTQSGVHGLQITREASAGSVGGRSWSSSSSMKYCAGAPHPVADATWRREKAVRAAVDRKGLEIEASAGSVGGRSWSSSSSMKYCAGAPHPIADATWRREKAVRAAVD